MPTNLFLSPTRAISLPQDICQERTRFENDSSSISEHLNNVSVVVGETALLSCRVDGDARWHWTLIFVITCQWFKLLKCCGFVKEKLYCLINEDFPPGWFGRAPEEDLSVRRKGWKLREGRLALPHSLSMTASRQTSRSPYLCPDQWTSIYIQGLTSTRYPTLPELFFATQTRPELFFIISEFRVFLSKLFPSRPLQIF